jgi:uncharacterized membrane protein
MWPFNYGFAVWGTVVIYVAMTVLYYIWMRIMNSRENGKNEKGGA